MTQSKAKAKTASARSTKKSPKLKSDRKFKIGITFNLEAKVTDIWSNGVNQNLIFLYELFQHSDIVEDVVFVSWGPEKRTTPPSDLMVDGLDLKFAYINDVIDDLDVLIEGGIIVEPHMVKKMHEHGGKVVCYKMGNDYIMDIEYFTFNQQPGRIFNGTHFDCVWMLPHHINTVSAYSSIMYRSPVVEIPWIWRPTFCNKVAQSLKEKHNLDFGYKPTNDGSAKRLACFEPNTFVLKSCFTSILIAEQAYRIAPEKIKHFYVCNTYNKKDHPTFFNFIGRTDMIKNHIVSVEKRYQMPDFLTRYTDIVLAHQWENGLNYAYNDALYGGYPFIHNSKMLPKGVGYYYDQFDAFEGADVLLDVIENHDKHHEEYVKRANKYLASIDALNPKNIEIHEQELLRLFA
ncbi:DUF2827 family protein [Avibacterium paragallinarum]|uniref:DUF2827 domain-containing protein n=2 Tax=Avibacterium TaxID=292486 RepID=A0ABU7QQK3_AVIPA|nr:DUF2827 family protein [Avibacterium paragallinarum]